MAYKHPDKWTEDLFLSLPAEDNRYEWKLGKVESLRDQNELRNKLGKELGAFANSFGGTLFVGISDDRDIVGVDTIFAGRQSFKEWLENVIPSLTEMRLQAFRVTPVELTRKTQEKIGEEKIVLAIDVQDSDLAPHQTAKDHKYYYRVSSKSEPAPHHYLAFLWGRTNPNMANVWVGGSRHSLTRSSRLRERRIGRFLAESFYSAPDKFNPKFGLGFSKLTFFRWSGGKHWWRAMSENISCTPFRRQNAKSRKSAAP